MANFVMYSGFILALCYLFLIIKVHLMRESCMQKLPKLGIPYVAFFGNVALSCEVEKLNLKYFNNFILV